MPKKIIKVLCNGSFYSLHEEDLSKMYYINLFSTPKIPLLLTLTKKVKNKKNKAGSKDHYKQ